MRSRRIRLFAALTITFVCAAAASAQADTIYLKNGRIITSSYVRVEGDRVFVRLFGGLVGFPMSMVDRIVEDDRVEARPTVDPTPEPPAAEEGGEQGEEVGQEDQEPGQEGGQPAGQEGAAGAQAAQQQQQPPQQPQTPPEETREYWQNRVRPLRTQLARLDRELAGLRNRARTDPDAARQLRDTEQARDDVMSQLQATEQEARRLNVPPGWLR